MDNNKGKRQFFLVVTTFALFTNLTGFAIGYYDKNMVNALVAVGLYDLWIGGVFVIMKFANKLYPQNNDNDNDNDNDGKD